MNQTPESTLGHAARDVLAELTLSPRLLSCDHYGRPIEPESLARVLGRPAPQVAAAIEELVDGGYMSMLVIRFGGCEALTWLQIGRSVA